VSVRGIAADAFAAKWSVSLRVNVATPPVIASPNGPGFDKTPTFTWNSVPGAVKYELYVLRGSAGSVVIYEQNLSTTSFTPTTELANGPYTAWVIALNAQNDRGLWSAPVQWEVGGRPTVLTPAGSVGVRPVFTWTAVEGAATYNLWVDRSDVYTRGYFNVNGILSSSWTPPADMPAGSYRVWIQAVSQTAEFSAWSTVMFFTVAASDYGPSGGDELNEFFNSFLLEESAVALVSEEFLIGRRLRRTSSNESVRQYEPTADVQNPEPATELSQGTDAALAESRDFEPLRDLNQLDCVLADWSLT